MWIVFYTIMRTQQIDEVLALLIALVINYVLRIVINYIKH